MSQKSMKLPKLYRIIVDVQFGDMLDECNKLYDGEGYGTVFTDANGDAVIDYLKQWDSDEWTDDDIRSEEPRWVMPFSRSTAVIPAAKATMQGWV